MHNGEGPRATRREILAAVSASALALSTGVGFAKSRAVATGRVFHDRSGTSRRSRGDPGIPEVMVSNGRNVVVTDSEGRWRLPIADGDGVFVIKPSGWTTPYGLGGVPRSFYSEAACMATAGIDFPLRPQDESSCFEALLMADTQPANGAELAYLRDDIIAAAIGSGAAFAINHGDIVFDDLSLYPRYLQILGASGIPWHHCPGNHDINSEAPDDRTSRETWKRVFGPRHYAFQHANTTFILLDNVYYFGDRPGAPDSRRYCGLIGERQLEFVRNVLTHVPQEQLLVLSMHIPLLNYQDGTSPEDNTADRHQLLELLASRPHTVSFAGHMHLTEHHYFGADEGFRRAVSHHHHVLTAASGGWWGGPKDGRGIPSADSQDGSPNGFHVLSVDGSRYTTRFVPAVGKGARQLRAVVDGPRAGTLAGGCAATFALDELGACELVVNVFDGGPATRVTFEDCRSRQYASPDAAHRNDGPVRRGAVLPPRRAAEALGTASALITCLEGTATAEPPTWRPLPDYPSRGRIWSANCDAPCPRVGDFGSLTRA